MKTQLLIPLAGKIEIVFEGVEDQLIVVHDWHGATWEEWEAHKFWLLARYSPDDKSLEVTNRKQITPLYQVWTVADRQTATAVGAS